ncbi:glucuronate isomerase [Entomospira entomophila]|uniref:Uronate isomerase n=1 Tax=Entomospira entomophila TaxID=2719988 RepID=A0A968KSU7_9SPIO|nr:glucuronate isomerase [Entomospira entomophilus]NIZ40727.1 glucuronate isomerase [Entomospira entomophilus]WDI34940.1 glucuronate isomerase [Entomospira entomophilus]
MKQFLDENFFLETKTAQKLYHEYAKAMPIYDYHCHLDPKEIAEDKQYANITQLWLGGDHYKWRLMRTFGINERYITGDASDEDKFFAWAKVISQSIGNPLYHWSHLELKRYFNIDLAINEENALSIWQETKRQLALPEFRARALIKRSNVTALNTTDDPIDSLDYHRRLAEDPTFDVKVLPTFRPDKGMYLLKESFDRWLEALMKLTHPIKNVADLERALELRLDFFHQHGCRISDHGLDSFVFHCSTSQEQADIIFQKKLQGSVITLQESEIYLSYLLLFLARAYAKRGWVMQLHMGVLRNINSQAYEVLGVDSGFDAIGSRVNGAMLAHFFDALQQDNALPKTILYSIHSSDNTMLTTIMGAFQQSVRGKIQLGSAWWFNDTKKGMEHQITDLASVGLLSSFVGMLTDSRSFISYPRHEYFRRILCNIVGNWVESGEALNDESNLKQLIEHIAFKNIHAYLSADFA